jgi:hypothetical protein
VKAATVNVARDRRVLSRAAAALLFGLSAASVPAADFAQTRAITSPALRADLVIKHLRLDIACRIVVTVSNAGRSTVPDSVWTRRAASGVTVTVEGKPFAAAPIWSFDPAKTLQPPGGSVEYVTDQGVTGSVKVRATIDGSRGIAEADENNNSATATLFCPHTRAIAKNLPRSVDGTAESLPLNEASPPPSNEAAPPATEHAGGANRESADTPSGGPSLLETQLPPPANLPPPPPREDKSVEPGELVVVSANMAEARALEQAAKARGLAVKRRTNLRGLGFVVTVLRVPKDVSVGDALTALRQLLPKAWVDANHRYELRGDESITYGRKLVGIETVSPFCGNGVRLGLVDTTIDANHPALRGRDIARRSFLPTGIPLAVSDHGTAVSALLVGNHQSSGFGGLAPGAKLYAAAVFRRSGNGADTTAEWIVQALDWLVQQRVQIVNMSLGGPRNLLLEAAVDRLLAKGVAVVAAAGNEGPDAPPVYPAAHRGVLAVTAIDAALKPWPKANRGEYISFAAPGVDVWSAVPGKDGAYLSGTSYATPFVVAALAAARQSKPKSAWTAIQQELQSKARDLGDKGKDPVFGWGLVQIKGCSANATALRHRSPVESANGMRR